MAFEDYLREVFQLAYRVHLAADGTARSAAMLALSDNLMTAAGRAADGVLDPVSLLGLIYGAIEDVDPRACIGPVGGEDPSEGKDTGEGVSGCQGANEGVVFPQAPKR